MAMYIISKTAGFFKNITSVIEMLLEVHGTTVILIFPEIKPRLRDQFIQRLGEKIKANPKLDYYFKIKSGFSLKDN